MKDPVTIRTATENDLPALLAIYNNIIAKTTAVYDYEQHTLDMRRQWFRSKQEQGMPVFVAENDGVIRGFSSIGPFRAWAAYQFTVENSVYVSEYARGQGIGRLLLAPLIDAAGKLGMHTIVAAIDATNAASLALHLKFGFEEVAHFRQVGWKFERWLDLKFLQLLLVKPGDSDPE